MRLQILQQGFITHRRLGDAFFKRCQVFVVFSQCLANSVINNVREATIGMGRFQAKRCMYLRVEINS